MPCFWAGEKLWQNMLLTLVFYLFFSSRFTLSRSLPFFLFVSFISHSLFSSPPRNAFLSSIFHLFPSFYLIIIYLPWWKIAFSARLSSTFIFHLPPSAIAWKTFLIPSYPEVYSPFLVCFPLKKHFHPLACLFENALPFFWKSFVICRLGYSLPPVRPIPCLLFPFSCLPE